MKIATLPKTKQTTAMKPKDAIRQFLENRGSVLQNDDNVDLAWWSLNGTIVIASTFSITRQVTLYHAIIAVLFGNVIEDEKYLP